MKKTALYTALMALSFPLSVHALGLGDMKVKSSLEQPFLAEIELIDTQSASLSSLKVALASPQNFERVGIAPNETVNLLQFAVKKNKQGRLVVMIHSVERISDPCLQLVVDLTWPKGQLYKAYTVLLDPPGYQLGVTTAQSGPTHYQRGLQEHHEKKIANKNTHSPKVNHENVWQIAQQYKTADTILPQVVLAIVGLNPEAFNEGNLNGLKVDAKLNIPGEEQIKKVPVDLATIEVMAHDKAWNEKTPINHVLSPPYTTTQTPAVNPIEEYSKVPPIPLLKQGIIASANPLPHLLPANAVPNETLKAEISITTAAVDSLRESNSALMEQLHVMQTENKNLHTQLEARDKEIKLISNQIQVMKKERMALEAANSSQNSGSSWPWLFLLMLVGGGGAAAFGYWKRKNNKHSEEATAENSSPLVETPIPVNYVPVIEEAPAKSESQFSPIEDKPESTPEEPALAETIDDENKAPKFESVQAPETNMLEFEPGLHQTLSETSEPAKTLVPDQEEAPEYVLEYTSEVSLPPEDSSRPSMEIKEADAFDTLLDLAKTYISMEDKESALNSLKEVLEHGNEAQKAIAQQLIDFLY